MGCGWPFGGYQQHGIVSNMELHYRPAQVNNREHGDDQEEQVPLYMVRPIRYPRTILEKSK